MHCKLRPIVPNRRLPQNEYFMKKIDLSAAVLAVAFALCAPNSVHAKNGAKLDCNVSTPQQEQAQFRRAPHGARRIGKHSLEVGWHGGKHLFKDKAPYDEPLSGVKWTYCGYNAALKMHLVQKDDESVFTGVFLDDTTGAVLPAGLQALFSPDFKYYLAYEQEDGRDGATIKLYERDGALKWQGYDGILTPDGTDIAATFESTHWNDRGQLEASVTCLTGPKAGNVTLTQVGGHWQWLPRVSCPVP